MDKEELARTLNYLADCVRAMERISRLPDCNNCGKQKTCEYLPDWGGNTRINCPLWEEE